MSKIKALVLLSGGLDSMLAARVLMEQGIEVTGLSFKSCFFGTAKGKKVAGQLGIELIEIDFSEEHLAMVKNPKHGYGKNINPCIDCHALMLKKAGEIMINKTLGVQGDTECPYDFVATGEVLGERPMSQNKEALKIVEKESGLAGKLIRPLSAKLLDESEPEKTGMVNRGRLLDISGRSRARQLELVKKYNIKEYASPGGGCLLTDPRFSEKLLKMFELWPECQGNDIELLKWGRINWLKANADLCGLMRTNAEKMCNILMIVGRDEKDNEKLEELAKSGDVLMRLADENGPTSLLRIMSHELRIMDETREIDVPVELKMSEFKLDEKKSAEEIINLGLILTGYYATKARGKKVKFNIINSPC
ncbi:MAG: tRNA 4-thiouridine(8) synthase ThiI [bacterium]|nr:tRNA 4-thiouridine(8) synthase ThiI [bacterium]